MRARNASDALFMFRGPTPEKSHTSARYENALSQGMQTIMDIEGYDGASARRSDVIDVGTVYGPGGGPWRPLCAWMASSESGSSNSRVRPDFRSADNTGRLRRAHRGRPLLPLWGRSLAGRLAAGAAWPARCSSQRQFRRKTLQRQCACFSYSYTLYEV